MAVWGFKKRYGHVGLFGSVPSHAEEKNSFVFALFFGLICTGGL
jgi:hypothetical protein